MPDAKLVGFHIQSRQASHAICVCRHRVSCARSRTHLLLIVLGYFALSSPVAVMCPAKYLKRSASHRCCGMGLVRGVVVIPGQSPRGLSDRIGRNGVDVDARAPICYAARSPLSTRHDRLCSI